MMNRLSILISFVFICLFTVSASSQTKDLSYFQGTWDFKIWFSKDTLGLPQLQATWVLEPGLDSTECYTGFVEIGGKKFTREIIAFNSVNQEYVRTIIADNGAYIIMKTNGWGEKNLTWTGTQYFNGVPTTLKEEIVKSGPNLFVATFYNYNNNVWQQTQTEVLTRIKE